MAKIIIPEYLARVIKLQKVEFDVKGTTVYEALNDLCENYTALNDHFFYINGDFKNYFLIVINQAYANAYDEIKDNDIIEIMLVTSNKIDFSSSILN